MSQYVVTPTRTFTAGAAIAANLRVKLTSGKLAVAGLADKEIGTITEDAFADNDVRAVHLRTAQGTVMMVASEAIAVGVAVHTAAAGKVGDTATATGFVVGTSISAATADGDTIEVLRNSHGDTANT